MTNDKRDTPTETTLIEWIPGTRIRSNDDGTFDRLYDDGRVERVHISQERLQAAFRALRRDQPS